MLLAGDSTVERAVHAMGTARGNEVGLMQWQAI